MLKEQIYTDIGDGNYKTRDFTVRSWKDFSPFLKFEDRKAWEGIDDRIKKIIHSNAEQYKDCQYPVLLASDFMQYFKNGSRATYEDKYFYRRHALSTLILDYCIDPSDKMLTKIIDGIWCICEESSWVVSAHNFIYEPDPVNGERTLPDISLYALDIFAGETGVLLALCHYLLKEELDKEEPLITERIRLELKRRIITPFLTRYDYWWMGYSDRRDINNWGPWCVMNCLICILFCEQEDVQRKRGIVRAMDMMDYYLQGISEDGGCDEGATYWGRACGMLLEGLNLTYYATDGGISIYGEKKLIQFTDYIRKMYIGKDYVVNFADGSGKCNPASEIIYTAGCRMDHKQLREFGAYCYRYQLDQGIFPYLSLSRALSSLKKSDVMLKEAGSAEFDTDLYIKSLEIMAARQFSHPEKGFFLCAKGGGNNDSHNHNDVGNFVCFYNGEPVMIDIGVEVYRREFFGPGRYNIWTMQSQYHNLPTINGCMQQNGIEYRAVNTEHSYDQYSSVLECELQKAYPNEEEIGFYKRRTELDRKQGRVIIQDSFQNGNLNIVFHFVTPCELSLTSEGVIFESINGHVIMRYNNESLKAEIETIELNDLKLRNSWGSRIYRLVLKTVGQEKDYRFQIEPVIL